MEAKNENRGRKKITGLLVKMVGSVCLLLLISNKLDFLLLFESLKSADAMYLIFAVMGAFVFITIRVFKWYGFLCISQKGLKFSRVFSSYCFGLGVGILTPGRVGEITRIHNLELEQKAQASGFFFLDKFIDLVVVFGMALCGMCFLFPNQINIFIFAGFVPGAILLLFSLRRIHYFFNSEKAGGLPFSDKFQKFFKAISRVPRPKIIFNALLTLLSYIICVYEEFFLLSAFAETKLIDVLFIHPIVMLTNAVPVTIGGLGLREGTSVFLYLQKGLAAEHAFLGGFLIFTFNTFFYGMLGIVSVNFTKLKRK
ncbi:MAG: flippase-like domain-containing protein [Candidatus Omnitrophica bacterium]|nr:flippase-like domain-containing protein [Candidatus Omnitrophota bacterium]